MYLTGTESLFQQAAQRLVNLGNSNIQVANPMIVTGEDHRFLASKQLREVGIVGCALLESVGRNTAPALTLVALATVDRSADAVCLVTRADQAVSNPAALATAKQLAASEGAKGAIAILGVEPDHPETGYGYIQTSPLLSGKAELIPVVQRFLEKPDATAAQTYLDQGAYYWNEGMFVLTSSVWLKVLQHFRPETLQAAWADLTVDNQFVRPSKDKCSAIPSESVDYADLERCPESGFFIKMVPLYSGWNDLGAWDAVWSAVPNDNKGNAHQGDVLVTNGKNTLVHASNRLVSLLGVENLIVIETPDAVMVADESRSQDVKHIAIQLQKAKRDEHTLHHKVPRPWGRCDSIEEGDRFNVKCIQVEPKASLSLQAHHRWAEHWIVVRGTALITNGDKLLTLTENKSTYISLGEVHRLPNLGTIPLEIIEVQSGGYLAEDNIIRFAGNYGRGH